MVDVVLQDEDIKKINKELAKSLQNYRQVINYMAADMPIGCLCLSRSTEKALVDAGVARVYDLFGLDLAEIKGLGAVRTRELTTCLDKFLAMG